MLAELARALGHLTLKCDENGMRKHVMRTTKLMLNATHAAYVSGLHDIVSPHLYILDISFMAQHDMLYMRSLVNYIGSHELRRWTVMPATVKWAAAHVCRYRDSRC